jgi:predicted dehydrogenase
MKEKVKIGVVGAGVYGTHVMKTLKTASLDGNADLVAVAEINSQVLERAAGLFRIRGYSNHVDMMDNEELDAVAVVTPDHLHKEIVLDVVSRKLHVLCQKPISTSSEEGKQMVEAAKQAGVMLFVDFHKRYDPAHRTLKKDIEQGKLGEILYGDVHMEDRIEIPVSSFSGWAHKSSPAWFLGTHFFDLVSWLINSRPIRVFGSGNKKKLLDMGIDTYDHVSAQVIYENGAVFNYHTSWILPANFPSIVNQQIRVVGTEGICEIDSQDRGMLSSYNDNPYCQILNPFSKMDCDEFRDLPMGGYTSESILHFVRLMNRLKNGVPLADLEGKYPSGQEALIATILSEAIHESIRKGSIIELK